jgi:hypothetical protein
VLQAGFEPMGFVIDVVRGVPHGIESFQIDGESPIEISIAPANATHEAKTNAALAKYGLRQALIAAGRPYHMVRKRGGAAATITISPEVGEPTAGGAAALSELWHSLMAGGRVSSR